MWRVTAYQETLPKPSEVDEHLRLIEKAKTFPFPEVLNFLRIIAPLKADGLPSQYQSQNFFVTVLDRREFTDGQKHELIMQSFYKGYEVHYLKLLGPSLLDRLLGSAELARLLRYVYIKAIREKKENQFINVREDILESLLAANKENAWGIFKAMLETPTISDFTFVNYIIFWLQKITTRDEVYTVIITVCQRIQNTRFMEYVDDLEKLGEIIMFDIMFSQKEPGIVLECPATKFLIRHRSESFLFKLNRSTSEIILDLYPRNPAAARDLHNKNKEKFLLSFNNKLSVKTDEIKTLRYRS